MKLELLPSEKQSHVKLMPVNSTIGAVQMQVLMLPSPTTALRGPIRLKSLGDDVPCALRLPL